MISAARLRWRDFLTLMCCNGTNVLQNFPAWIHTKHLHRGRILCIIWPVDGQGMGGWGRTNVRSSSSRTLTTSSCVEGRTVELRADPHPDSPKSCRSERPSEKHPKEERRQVLLHRLGGSFPSTGTTAAAGFFSFCLF